MSMVIASDPRSGMIVEVEERLHHMLAAEYRVGGGKMPGQGTPGCKTSPRDRAPTAASAPRRSLRPRRSSERRWSSSLRAATPSIS